MISSVIISISVMAYRMVTPFPHKTSTHEIIILNHLEIILEISRSISHAVRIFDQQIRFTAILLEILLYFFQRRVHPAIKIQIRIIVCFMIITISCTLILRQSAVIKGLRPCQCFLKVTSIGTFISHRPNYNTRTIHVSMHQKTDTICDCLLPHRIIRNFFTPTSVPLKFIVHFSVQQKWTMRLNICLIDHHKSILIAQLIKHWCVWIMTGSDRIHVVLLH